MIFDYVKPTAGISELASISTTARLGNNLHIGAFCSIADNVIIGDNCVLHPHVVIYPNVKLGDNAVIHSGACIRENTVIGDNVVIQNGTTVGSDGFGYVQNPKHGLRLVPQLGRVSLGDDVELS
ncbi:MAG: DapH/DapD/GlmU-related protein [Bdellovibrionota bacterium]